MQGTILVQRENSGIPSTPGPWNSWQGSVPSSGMLIRGNPFHGQWNHGQGTGPIPMGLVWGNPSQIPSNTPHAQPSTSYYGHQSMMSRQMLNQYTGQGHGFYQNPSQQTNFSWQPSAIQTPGPYFPVNSTQPKLSFLPMLHLLDLERLLNNPIFHDLRWSPCQLSFPQIF
jgi:hypothetical protein